MISLRRINGSSRRSTINCRLREISLFATILAANSGALVAVVYDVAWRLVQVRPNADRIAARNLERQGFVTFQPLETVTSVRGGRFVSRRRSFFPGYMFASYPAPAASWSLVNSTYGVARLVKFGDRPALVPGSLIAELQGACDENGIVRSAPGVIAGASVEVRCGSLTGIVGEVLRLEPDNRATVLIEFLGKQTRARIPVTQLKVTAPMPSVMAQRHG